MAWPCRHKRSLMAGDHRQSGRSANGAQPVTRAASSHVGDEMPWSTHFRLGLPQTATQGASPAVGGDTVPRLLLSIVEVSRVLGISERFAKNLISSGELPSLRIGRLRRVYLGDLLNWIERQRSGPLDRLGDEAAHLGSDTIRRRPDAGTGRSADRALREPD